MATPDICLITPQKPLNPFTSSKSHQELHRELRMSHRRSDRCTNS
uniref:Actin-associated protein FAM107A n=1 Tax=Sphaeramia orbicularis TaxID=375764 RepID=A0A673AH83_9TELE